MAKLVVGINDLATLHPENAAEADGWDPSTLLPGSNKKIHWTCNLEHAWKADPYSRNGRDKTTKTNTFNSFEGHEIKNIIVIVDRNFTSARQFYEQTALW